MNDKEVLAEMRSDSRLNRVRRVFSSEAAGLEQAGMQRQLPSPLDYRRMEFAAAEKLIAEIDSE